MRYYYFIYMMLICIVSLNACSHKTIPSIQVKDLIELSQDASTYIQKTTQDSKEEINTTILKNDYLDKYFSPWDEKPNPKVDEVFWIVPSLTKNPGFGEHLQKNSFSYIQEILDSMQIKSYPKIVSKAIITTTTNVRAVPTSKPMFNKPNDYPFDRWQNSLIFAGTPVLITHISQDKAWLHIQSAFVYGWIKNDHVAILDDRQIREIRAFTDRVTPIKDNVPLYDNEGNFIMYARVGQVFPIKTELNNKLKQIQLINYIRLPDGKAKQEVIYAATNTFTKFPLQLNEKNVAQSINSLIAQRYGWGGILENRDCSAFIRDIFAQYAIHLPRNSKAQVLYGRNSINLNTLNRKEKETVILANATPFQTILWQDGHIMLYLGHFKGKPIVAHSAWSVTTGKRYENMLGGVVITTLYVGDEHNKWWAKSPLLIDKIQAMSNLSTFAKRMVDEKQNKW